MADPSVAGTAPPVSARVLEDALAWNCPCPDDAPCVHAVSAAPTWVRAKGDFDEFVGNKAAYRR